MNLRIALSAAALATVLAVSTAAAQCPGDCRNDGAVTIDELMILVNIALDNSPHSDCQSGDLNDDDTITVDEIVAAVSRALSGCIPDVAGHLAARLGGDWLVNVHVGGHGDRPAKHRKG